LNVDAEDVSGRANFNSSPASDVSSFSFEDRTPRQSIVDSFSTEDSVQVLEVPRSANTGDGKDVDADFGPRESFGGLKKLSDTPSSSVQASFCETTRSDLSHLSAPYEPSENFITRHVHEIFLAAVASGIFKHPSLGFDRCYCRMEQYTASQSGALKSSKALRL
jgi:hypothetical protein